VESIDMSFGDGYDPELHGRSTLARSRPRNAKRRADRAMPQVDPSSNPESGLILS
jgi:hypothetical protein